MRNYLLFVFITVFAFSLNAQVGIGTTTPDTSSVLDVASTEKGMLIPRMLVSERIIIVTPAEGLLVYQTDDIEGFYYYDGTQWVRLLDKSKDAVPTGAIFSFPKSTPPTGYLECDGSAINRTVYADLFALIGVTYGAGDGTTTFNLPDYRGQFLRGFDNAAGVDPNAAARLDRGDGTTGDAVGTKQNNGTASHNHSVDPPNVYTIAAGNHNHNIAGRTLYTNTTGNHQHNVTYNNVSVEVTGPGANYTIQELGGANTWYTNTAGSHYHNVNLPTLYTNTTGNHTHSINIPAFNSSTKGGSETRPKNVSVLWCIKY